MEPGPEPFATVFDFTVEYGFSEVLAGVANALLYSKQHEEQDVQWWRICLFWLSDRIGDHRRPLNLDDILDLTDEYGCSEVLDALAEHSLFLSKNEEYLCAARREQFEALSEQVRELAERM
jgi:hypothetical protein